MNLPGGGDTHTRQAAGGGKCDPPNPNLGHPVTFRGFSGVGASSTEASISLAGIQVS